jgi:hypothetical protein
LFFSQTSTKWKKSKLFADGKNAMNVLINIIVEMISSKCIAETIFQNKKEVSGINLFETAFK